MLSFFASKKRTSAECFAIPEIPSFTCFGTYVVSRDSYVLSPVSKKTPFDPSANSGQAWLNLQQAQGDSEILRFALNDNPPRQPFGLPPLPV